MLRTRRSVRGFSEYREKRRETEKSMSDGEMPHYPETMLTVGAQRCTLCHISNAVSGAP
jgi:hypothetical protein